ncbi:MAG: uracil-DNA glycosylase family protein [Pseudomonadota bacterium]
MAAPVLTGNSKKRDPADLTRLVADIRACTLCAPHFAHQPRPVLQVSATARIGIFGQAPGTRVHASGRPFTDPSGDRLRIWMGVDEAFFYDASKVAIVPMGFCFPGQNHKGADLPPRPECAQTWRAPLMDHLAQLDLILLVGLYAQRWHLGAGAARTLTQTVANWRDFGPRFIPMPHPSWRNNAWLARNRVFENEIIPVLRQRITQIRAHDPARPGNP